jgi:tetratricopeptide (TPR) repeat protein
MLLAQNAAAGPVDVGRVLQECRYAAHGSPRKAACIRALEVSTSAHPRYWLAIEHLRSNEWSEAQLAFKRAASVDRSYYNPKRDGGLYWLHLAESDSTKLPVAIALLDSASIQKPGDQEVTYARAAAYYLSHRDAEAGKLFRDLLSRGGDDDWRIHVGYAKALEAFGSFTPALLEYGRAYQMVDEPSARASCLAGQARINAKLGRPAVALEYWKRAMALDPSIQESDAYQWLYRQSRKNAGLIARPDTQNLQALYDSTQSAADSARP